MKGKYTSKTVAAHRSGIGNIEVTVNPAVEGVIGVGVEVEATLRVDPLVDKVVNHDVTVPGRFVTGLEESEHDEP